eukprot:gene14920-17114_t
MSALKNILITGASRGIGLGLAKHLLEAVDGVRIIATYRNSATASKLFDLASSYPKDKLLLVELDTTSEASYRSASSELSEAGVKSLDVVVANAGVVSVAPTLTASAAETMQVLNTNVVGSLLTVQAFHGLLTADKEGAKLAVFTAATMGSIEKTIETKGGAVAYRASKAAMNMVAACYAKEQARFGVKVLAVHPGWVQTDMGKTYGKPPMTVEDSAKGITQLLLTAAQVQLKTTDAVVPDKLVKFEEKFKKSSIVFSTLDGELLSW